MKIPNFPLPYPDEILYSLVARYCWLTRCRYSRAVRFKLFGSTNAGIMFDFPNRLAAFQEVYRSHAGHDLGWIIHNLTMLPFYGRFIPAQKLTLIDKSLEGSDNGKVLSRVGVVGSGILLRQPYIRYCPACAEEERNQNGEAYWHRLPQLPGVHVCPIHLVFFEESTIPVPRGYNCRLLSAAEAMIPTRTERRNLDPANASHMTLLSLAKSASWLTENKILGTEFELLRPRYRALAMNLGYLTGTGFLRWTKLLQDFRSRYTPELLERLYSTLPSSVEHNHNNWIRRVFSSAVEVQVPIRHLLLMHYFGLDAQTYFSMDHRVTMFGPGPFDCENPVCPDYLQKGIREIHLGHSRAYKCPQAIFSCPFCEQKTVRLIVNGRTRARILEHGALWIQSLTRLWSDPTIGMPDMARQLGVERRTIILQAAKAGLPFPRKGPRGMSCKKSPLINAKRSGHIERERITRRKEWLELCSENARCLMMELVARAPRCYTFLYRYDRQWLRQHSPAAKRHRPPLAHPVIDWNERDQLFQQEAIKALQDLRDEEGFPHRITIDAIRAKMGRLSVIRKHMKQLPKTKKVLLSGREGVMSFSLRKIAWAARLLREEHGRVDMTALIKRAQLSQASLRECKIIEAINELLC